MLSRCAVEIPTLPVDECHSHLHRYLEGCCAAEKVRQHLAQSASGNVFTDPHTSSSAPYPQELHQWNWGNFKDVRFYPTRNFGHFWAPSLVTLLIFHQMSLT